MPHGLSMFCRDPGHPNDRYDKIKNTLAAYSLAFIMTSFIFLLFRERKRKRERERESELIEQESQVT